MMQTTAMKSPAFQSYHSGFSLVELMIALVVGLLISAIAISSFLGHARVLYQQLSYNQATEDVSETFAVLSRLVMQAQRSTVSVTSSATATTIDLALPELYMVWPNIDDTTASPYDKNWVRIAWTNTGSNANQITIANSSSSGGLGTASVTTFAGAAAGNNTRFTGMTLAEDNSTDPSTYVFSLSGKAWARDMVDGDDTAKGVTIEGRILPRN